MSDVVKALFNRCCIPGCWNASDILKLYCKECSVKLAKAQQPQVTVVNCGANEVIEIDKLYGPLAAHNVRIRLEYKDGVSDWVVESQDLKNNTWKERARWDCQDDWPNDEEAKCE